MTPTMLRNQVDQALRDLEPELIRHRHHLHRNPELSNREIATAAYLVEQLRQFGVDEIRTDLAGHGVIGVIRGGKPGDKTIALRADMDALPVRETSGVSFASDREVEGPNGTSIPVAHACGHDCHMATVLIATKVLAMFRSELPGTVLCVFQPAEEGAPIGEQGGAQVMIDEGAFAGVEPTMVFGMHVSPFPSGTVAYRSGSQFAASTRVEVIIQGRQTHAAMPWLGVDPMPAAAGVIMGAAHLVRRIPVWQPATVTFGHVEDQGRFNIIGDRIRLEGTIRCAEDADMERLKTGLHDLAIGQAQSHDCSADVRFDHDVPAVVNQTEWVESTLPTLRRLVGQERLLVSPPTLGYDDVSALIRRFGGLYVLYGAQDTRWVTDGSGASALEPIAGGRGLVPNHHPSFYAKDDALRCGAAIHAHIALDHLYGLIDPSMTPTIRIGAGS